MGVLFNSMGNHFFHMVVTGAHKGISIEDDPTSSTVMSDLQEAEKRDFIILHNLFIYRLKGLIL